jgi:hypothetical protein
MGLLNLDERKQLRDLLFRLPNLEDRGFRVSLLSNLPRDLREHIASSDIPSVHIDNIIATVDGESAQRTDGSWPIIQIIEKAISAVPGTMIATKLQDLLNAVQKRSLDAAQKSTDDPRTRPNLLKPVGQQFQEQINTTALRQILTTLFNISELKDVCADLNIDYENLPGESKGDKARELIAYAKRHDCTADLIALVHRLRPHVNRESVKQQMDLEQSDTLIRAVEAATQQLKDLGLQLCIPNADKERIRGVHCDAAIWQEVLKEITSISSTADRILWIDSALTLARHAEESHTQCCDAIIQSRGLLRGTKQYNKYLNVACDSCRKALEIANQLSDHLRAQA